MSTRSLSVIRLHLITRGEGSGGERRPPLARETTNNQKKKYNSVYGHVITKFSGMGRFSHFLSYGAPHEHVELRYSLALISLSKWTNWS